MTPEFTLQHRNVYLREDHELVGRVLSEKLRLRTDRTRIEDGYRVMGKGTGRG